MRRLNKNFLTFTFTTFFLGISALLILYKLLPTFLSHTVYYCQQLFNSYSIKIPQQVSLIIMAFVSVTIIIFLLRVFLTIVKIHLMKNRLLENEKETKSISKLVEKVGLESKVLVIEDAMPFAFCLGIRSPHIYVSTKTVSIMTKKQLEAILLHEKYHLEHADSLTLFIGSLPQLLFPFFPILPRLLERYKIEREIKADKQAAKELGATKPVIGVLKKLLQTPPVSPAFVSSMADTNSLEIRIKSLLNKRTESIKIKKIDFVISIFSLILIIASIAAPVHAVEIHTNNQNIMIVCLQDNECSRWCQEHNSFTPYKANVSYPYSSVK